jgi:hypothetical protein
VLWREISEYNPDLVIHYTGHNDISISYLNIKPGWNFPLISQSSNEENPFVTLAKNLWIRIQVSSKVFSKFAESFKLYDSLKYRFELVFRVKHKDVVYSDSNEISDIFAKNMIFSTKVGESLNVPVLIFIQPSLYTEKKHLTSWESYMLNRSESDYPGWNKFYLSTRNLMIQKITQEKLDFVDTKDFFANENENLYLDTAHYNDIGNEIVAKQIANIILSKRLIK